jgi:hypothetical protein
VRYRPDDASRVWFRTDDGVVLEAKAVAGRALGERYHLPLDAAQRERLEEGRAEGVELSEAIADNAVKETRKVKRTPAQNRPPKGRGGRKKAKAPDGSEPTSTRSILPEPNRASVTTEELF